jgi:enoyl-CoA hydratase
MLAGQDEVMNQESRPESPSGVVIRSMPRPGVAQLEMNRPERLNAMTAELVSELHRHFDEIAVDPEIRVVVLTGAGRGFCAGLDITGYGQAPHTAHLGPTQKGLAVQKHIASLIPHLRSLPQPVIAAVNGPAAGGGFALVLGSDVRLASTTASFSAAFIKIGVSACDIGTSWLLPRLIGAARAQELMLTGRVFRAPEAERIGLVMDLIEPENLLETAYAKAEEIMQNAPFAVTLTKEGMWSALEIPGLQAAIDLENRQQIMATATFDHREAMTAFVERRPPEFQNR